MTSWVLAGLRSGIRTTGYPARAETTPGTSPGRPLGARPGSAAAAERLAQLCPTGAIRPQDGAVAVEQGRCVHCFRCVEAPGWPGLTWEGGYEWAGVAAAAGAAQDELARAFGRSLHIRFLDAGACGACMSEARQLNNPYYNMHRLGLFTTPTPRNADVLIVAGPVSDAMRLPLRKTYDAMPPPKRVIAIGACAASGGVFGPSFAAAGGVAGLIPVDVVVPGCPPPPLAILHALLVVTRRKPSAPLTTAAPERAGTTP